jgi:valyl-tRNA synthetase
VPDAADLTDADRWILHRLGQVRETVDEALERYEFSKACEALYHFAWDEVCDWYLELAKVQFGNDDESRASERAERTRLVLGHVLDVLLRMLHPVIPFVTETLWTALTGGESLVIAPWPTDVTPADDASDAVRRVGDAQTLVTEIRRFRSDQGLKPGQRVPARIGGVDGADLPADLLDQVASLARLTPAADDFTATASLEVRLGLSTVDVEIDTSGTIDLAAERRRLEKDLAAAHKELETTGAKLGNEAFLGKAPDHVVDKIRARRDLAEAEVARITARLETMPAGSGSA